MVRSSECWGQTQKYGRPGVPDASDIRRTDGALSPKLPYNNRIPAEQLQRLRAAVNGHCPVLDILTKPVPVELKMEIKQPAAVATA